MRQRQAVTFVEVLVSAGILITGCLVVLALLPASLKAQQMARYRIWAAANATTLMEAFAHPPLPPTPGVDTTYVMRNGPGSLATTAYTNPPSPGWASHLRTRRVFGSSFAYDLEQVVSRPQGGLIPVPAEIARRLDSDGDELQRHLAAGGAVFYLEPAQFRGVSRLAVGTDVSAQAGMPEEFQHLICAVVSPAQQDTLPAAPFEAAGPMRQRYPFPPLWQWWEVSTGTAPAWQWNRAYALGDRVTSSGNQYRCLVAGTSAAAPSGTGADIADGSVHWTYESAAVKIPSRTATVSEPWSPPTIITTASYGDSGELASGSGMYRPSRGAANGAITWAAVPAVPVSAPAPDATLVPFDDSTPIGQAHGCSWKHLADVDNGRLNHRSPYLTGWWAFKRLAGDEWAGWLPVQFALDWAGAPPTYEQLANYRDRALFLWMRVMPPSLRTAFPAPVLYVPDDARRLALLGDLNLAAYRDGATPTVHKHDDGADANRILVLCGADRPGASPAPPAPPWSGAPPSPGGYLASNVKAHAVEYLGTATAPLWSWSSDVQPTSPYRWCEFRWVEPKDYAGEAGKQRLRDIPVVDPYSLPAAEFPPHPAQVLALSYAAHACMLLAGAVDTRDAATGSSSFNGYRPFTPAYGASANYDPKVTDSDRVLARKLHEMALRWAVACANERPADFGAPRPDNRPIMNDRPLQVFDLWFDNTQRSTSPPFAPSAAQQAAVGNAVRLPRKNPRDFSLTNADVYTGWDRGNTAKESFESFYRWIEPANPTLPGRTASGVAAVLPRVRSGVGPVGWPWYHASAPLRMGNPFWHWAARNDPDPATRNAAVGTPWPNWLREPVPGNDAAHAWVERPFLAQHRARELVYWAVDWKAYEDSEEAPSHPVDFARTGRHVDIGYPDNNGGNVAIANWINPAFQETGLVGGSPKGQGYGGPEFLYAWTDETRTANFIRSWNANSGGYQLPLPISPNGTGITGYAYVHLGAFGADRNMNGVFDRGPVPRTVRMRAQQVARFAFYDPVLTLDQGGN